MMSDTFNPAACWVKYTIVRLDELDESEKMYLNHSCMSSLSFGAEEMMWITDDLEQAENMLVRVREMHKRSYATFKMEEIEG